MNERIELGRYNILPPVVKNLLIINGLFFVATIFLEPRGIFLDKLFGLHYVEAPDFKIWQIFTYMFMHGNFGHLFFNMFSLWMFGAAIENLWGSKRFLIYYLITGIGAAIIHYIVIYFQIHQDIALFNLFLENPKKHFAYQYHFAKDIAKKLKEKNIDEIYSDDKTLDIRLRFYNIKTGTKYFITENKPEYFDDVIKISYYNVILKNLYIIKK